MRVDLLQSCVEQDKERRKGKGMEKKGEKGKGRLRQST
jgi:hypothetical protein